MCRNLVVAIGQADTALKREQPPHVLGENIIHASVYGGGIDVRIIIIFRSALNSHRIDREKGETWSGTPGAA